MTNADLAWTSHAVRDRLAEACRTLRMVDTARGPNSRSTWWPDVVAHRMTDYPSDTTAVSKVRATAEQISRMDEVMGWVTRWLSEGAVATTPHLVPDAGWLVMARASGMSYEQIGRKRNIRYGVVRTGKGPNRQVPGGNSRKSLMLIEARTLAYVATQLNNDRAAVRPADDHQAVSSAREPDGTRKEGLRTIAPARTAAL